MACRVALQKAHTSAPIHKPRLALSYIQVLHGPTRLARRDFNNEFTVNQPESFYVGFQ